MINFKLILKIIKMIKYFRNLLKFNNNFKEFQMDII